MQFYVRCFNVHSHRYLQIFDCLLIIDPLPGYPHGIFTYIEAGTNSLRINTRFYATLSNGLYLRFLLSYSFHSSFVCIYCNAFSFLFCDPLLSLMYSTTFLYFVIGSLFICTLKWIIGYVFGGPYLLFFIVSIWIYFVYDLIITAYFHLSTHFFKKLSIFSNYF